MTVIDVLGVTLDAFARFIHPFGRPVINRTGLTGMFDIHLEWEEADADAPSDPHATSSIGALREQLGIRLESTQGSQEVLIVEHIARASEN